MSHEFELPESFHDLRRGEHSDQVILDPDTTLETFFLFTGVIGVIAIMVGVMGFFDGKEFPRFDMSMLGLGTLLTVLGFWLRSNLDDHYLLDFRARELFFCRTFFGRRKVRPVATFPELHCVSIGGKRWRGKHDVTWDYKVELVTKRGERVVVLESNVFETLLPKAQEVSKLLKVDVIPEPVAERYLAVRLADGLQYGKQVELTYEPHTVVGRRRWVRGIAVGLWVVGLAALFWFAFSP